MIVQPSVNILFPLILYFIGFVIFNNAITSGVQASATIMGETMSAMYVQNIMQSFLMLDYVPAVKRTKN